MSESISEPGPAAVGETIAGRYLIVRMLGQGGMGAVFQATQLSMDRQVALKLIHARVANHPDVIKRFQREMQATSRIEHPNVIAVFDYGQDNGRLFLAMEFLPGRPLSKVIEGGPMPVERLLHIALQVTRALGAAHQTGIAHRDLKPDNIMLLERYGEPDFVKVLDFGIARFLDDEQQQQQVSQMTAAGAIIGTPMYMSPEQALGHAIDHRSDFYSLGVMLYQMALGEPPFSGPSLASLIVAHAHQEPPAPSSVRPGAVSPKLEALLLRLLAKSPADRPATAAELLVLLDECRLERAATAVHAATDGAVDALGQTAASPGASSPPSRGPSAAMPAQAPGAARPPTAQRTAEVEPLPAPMPAPIATTQPPLAAPGKRSLGLVAGVAALLVLGGGGAIAWKLSATSSTGGGAGQGSGSGSAAGPGDPNVGVLRARLDALMTGDGDPLAPAACQTRDPALLDKLVRATGWLHDSAIGAPRPQDRDAFVLLDKLPEPSAELLALQARARLVVEATAERSLDAAKQAAQVCPTFAMAHNLIGNAEQRAKHSELATAAYQKALELAPDYQAPRYNLGLIALRAGDAKAAIAAFDEVLTRNPQHPRASLVRGQAHLSLGNTQLALDDLERAVLRNPDLADAWLLLGSARAKAGRSKEAKEAFCRAKEKGSEEGKRLCQ